MLKVELQRPKKNTEIYQAKEWELVWHHQSIRERVESFSTLCFMLEVVGKLAEESELDDDEVLKEHSGGTFRCLSNAVFYLDRELKKGGKQSPYIALSFFLGKLLIELGIFPDLHHCILTETPLTQVGEIRLLIDQGGFAFSQGLEQEQGRGVDQDDRALWHFLGDISQTKFQDLKAPLSPDLYKIMGARLFHYFCYQFHFSESDFKSFKMVF